MEKSKEIKTAIESLLLVNGEPLSFKQIAKVIKASVPEVGQTIEELREEYKEKGINILEDGQKAQLVTNPDTAPLLESHLSKDLKGKLGQAALETLAIISYRGPITRPQVEAVRGVNCTFTLRNLLIRGLVERTPNPEDARTYLYKVSFDFLKFIGLDKVEELPDFDELHKNALLESYSESFVNEATKSEDE